MIRQIKHAHTVFLVARDIKRKIQTRFILLARPFHLHMTSYNTKILYVRYVQVYLYVSSQFKKKKECVLCGNLENLFSRLFVWENLFVIVYMIYFSDGRGYFLLSNFKFDLFFYIFNRYLIIWVLLSKKSSNKTANFILGSNSYFDNSLTFKICSSPWW